MFVIAQKNLEISDQCVILNKVIYIHNSLSELETLYFPVDKYRQIKMCKIIDCFTVHYL